MLRPRSGLDGRGWAVRDGGVRFSRGVAVARGFATGRARGWVLAAWGALGVLGGVPVRAQPIVIEAPDGFVLIRCVDMFGSANCEFLTASTEDYLHCAAFDAEARPLAVTVAAASANMGSAIFVDLDARLVARVMCRP